MQTSVVINDELLKNAMKLSGKKTQGAAIEEALKIMVNLYEESSIKKLKGNLDEMREGRFSK